VLRGFFAFAVCFSILFWVWYDHYRFFRRYGLADGVTTTLTGALLFIVLFYVYPMKFLFAMLFDQLFGRPHPISSGSLRMRSATTAEGTTATPMSPEASWTGASSSWTERPNWITTV
jgi:hypothetical protein